MNETLSVTKALVELKTLNKRIEKKTLQPDPIAVSKGDKLPGRLKSRKDFDEKITAFEAEVNVALSVSNARTDITLN
jgi:hypothetical protein